MSAKRIDTAEGVPVHSEDIDAASFNAEGYGVHDRIPRNRETQGVAAGAESFGAQIEDVSSGAPERTVEAEIIIGISVALSISCAGEAGDCRDPSRMQDDSRR